MQMFNLLNQSLHLAIQSWRVTLLCLLNQSLHLAIQSWRVIPSCLLLLEHLAVSTLLDNLSSTVALFLPANWPRLVLVTYHQTCPTW